MPPRRFDGLRLPEYDGGSLPNLAVSVARASGFRDRGGPPLCPPLRHRLDPFEGRSAEGTIVLFLVDGFGFGDLVRWASDGGAGVGWAERAHPITTVFPSTTTAALASLSTGTPPGRHGLVGYRQYLPRFGLVADMLKMTAAGLPGNDLLVGPAWKPSDVSGAPSLFRRGLRGTALTRDRFQPTGFTRLLYDGASFVGYATASDFAQELVQLLERPRPPPVIYAYWDELDTLHHLKGPTPALAGLELDHLHALLGFVARRLSPRRRDRATLLVTGDHGQVPATREGRIGLERLPGLHGLLSRPLTGDRRAGFLAIRPGQQGKVERILRRACPPGSRLVPMEIARRSGLFGPPPFHPELEARTGDLLVLVPSPYGLADLLPGRSPPPRHLFGAHGGLEPEEMEVPLVRWRFRELAASGAPSGKR
jgi:hypothetical protein